MSVKIAEVTNVLNAIADPDDQVTAIERYLDALSADAEELFAEVVRSQAADEGCRWSDLNGEDIYAVKDIAGWSDKDFADVLSEKVVEFAVEQAELDDLHAALTSSPVTTPS